MLDLVLNYVSQSFELDFAGWVVMLIIGGASYTLLSQMLDDHGSAMLGTPIILLCAVLGNKALLDLNLFTTGDKVIDGVVGLSAGMMLGMGLTVGVLWSLRVAGQR